MHENLSSKSSSLGPETHSGHSRRAFLASAAALVAASQTRSAKSEDKPATDPQRDPLLISTNPIIAKARDTALGILKPSQAELDRGLKLHRESLVFDTYGFAPRAAIDPAEFNLIADQGASDAELSDLREEMSMTRPAKDPAERQEFMDAFEAAGVTCIFQNAGEEGQDPLRLLKRLARFTYLGDMLDGTLQRAAHPDDIERAHKQGEHCLYLTGNGVPIAQQWETIEEELGYVRLFYQLGIRMMHVTYNRRNMLGDGCAEVANGGLSDFGRSAIAEMNRVGVIVDVAHSGWKTSGESAEVSEKPMVASHTTADALNHHIRAKPDDVIRKICDTDGMVGVCCIPNFLGGTGDIAALLDHIDYLTKKFGVQYVGIGTDVAHTSRHNAEANRQVTYRAGKRRSRFAALWPSGSLGGNWPRSGSLAWTNWPLFTVGLVQRGYSDDQIRQILGGNMLRVCRANLS